MMIPLRRTLPLLSAALLAALATACDKTPEPAPSAPPDRPAPTSAAQAPAGTAAAPAAQAPKGPSDLAWDAPAEWESVPNPNAMRKATYKVKRADGDSEDAELSVSQAGGSVDANVERWSGQFQKEGADAVKRSERKVGELKVTVLEVHGTFAGGGMPGMPGSTPKPSSALLGAIVETGGGPLWFFKMTGPEKTVAAAKGGFDKLVDSLRAK